MVFTKSRDFSEPPFRHLQNEMIAIPKGFPKKPADECKEMRDGGWGRSLCEHVGVHLISLDSPASGAVPLQLKNPAPPLLCLKTSSEGSMNTASILNTVRVRL